MIKLKGECIFSIIRALEDREKYAYVESLEDRLACRQALEFFKSLSFEIEKESKKVEIK